MAQEKPDSKPLNKAEQAPEQEAVSPSSAADFKKKKEELTKPQTLTLPSGLTVEIKRPSVRVLIAKGFIPDSIAAKIVNVQAPGKPSKFRKEDFEEEFQLQQIVAVHSVTSPVVKPVGEAADEAKNEINVEDLDDADIGTIFFYVTTGARPDAVESFRGQQTGVPT